MPTMTVEEFRRQTRREIESQRTLAETDPARARSEALERLRGAGIVDGDGRLTGRYRG